VPGRPESSYPSGTIIPVTITDPLWVRLLMWLGFPAAGAGVGWLLPRVADWVAGLSWVPFQGPFKLVSEIPEPGRTWGALGLGLVAGLVVAMIGHSESLTLTVDHTGVTIKRGDRQRTVQRTEIQGVFLDGKHVVLLGREGQELARESSDLDKGLVEEVFRKQGYAWLADGDPHRGDYRRWVEADPDLPQAADAFLRARARALKDDKKEDVAELRGELAKLGVVVRDEKKKQYWRPQRSLR
jgi:hypothetical protein